MIGFKKTQFKDALRNIKNQWVSYISIIVIAFLGVTAYLGVDFTSYALKKNGSDMYNGCNYRDIEIESTLLLSEQDMEAVRKTEGVADAEEVWQLKVKVASELQKQDANVISVTERLNRAEVVEGRFPADADECAVEKRLADEMGWKIGDEITLQDSGIDLLQVLKNNKYKITGIVNHPDHTCVNVPDTLYVMVKSDAFRIQLLENSCMKAVIAVDKPSGINRFSNEYDAKVDDVKERLEKLAAVREPLRTDEVRDILGSAEPCKWYITDRFGNPSCVQLTVGSSNLSKMKNTFSLLFIIVGSLVIYASITKMVDEQRNQVGACKAFGLRNREVLLKYMLYGISATVTGMAAGVLAASLLMERFILKSYDIYYTFSISTIVVRLRSTLTVLGAGVMLAVLATFISCGMLMRSSAVTLMRPKVPATRKKPEKRRKFFSLYFRLIVRNMLRDWKRVIVTTVCVAGCCALVVIGFTMKFAVNGTLKKQYTTIVDFDTLIKFDGEACETAEDEIAAKLDEAGCTYVALYNTGITYRVTDIQLAELLCGDISEISSMYHLRDWKTGEDIAPIDSGILIYRRVAEIYGLDKGSEFTIGIGGTKFAAVTVAGVYENYIGRSMIASPAYYKELYGKDCVNNAFFVKYNGADGKALEDVLSTVNGYDSSTPSDKGKEMFDAVSSIIIIGVAINIFMATVMAGVVLLNLTNTYIMQKKTELTIMRINGFTAREVKGYVLRETVVTTVTGIVLGIISGSVISYHIIRSMEQPFLQFDRDLCPKAWLIGTVMTLFFTVVINIIALHRIKDLKLADISKN